MAVRPTFSVWSNRFRSLFYHWSHCLQWQWITESCIPTIFSVKAVKYHWHIPILLSTFISINEIYFIVSKGDILMDIHAVKRRLTSLRLSINDVANLSSICVSNHPIILELKALPCWSWLSRDALLQPWCLLCDACNHLDEPTALWIHYRHWQTTWFLYQSFLRVTLTSDDNSSLLYISIFWIIPSCCVHLLLA